MSTQTWIACSGGQVPPAAIAVGQYFVGRTKYRGLTIFGKVHPDHGVLYYPLNGHELRTESYEVLITTPGTKFSWISTSKGNLPVLPADSTIVGDDQGALVAACYLFKGHRIPGMCVRGDTNAHFAYDKKDVTRDVYDILVASSTHLWVEDSNGHVPSNAVPVGEYFVGRTKYRGSTIFGKVHPDHGVLYYPLNGQEFQIRNYEVLIITPGTNVSWISTSRGSLPDIPAGSTFVGDYNQGVWVAACNLSLYKVHRIPGMCVRGDTNAHFAYDSKDWTRDVYDILVVSAS